MANPVQDRNLIPEPPSSMGAGMGEKLIVPTASPPAPEPAQPAAPPTPPTSAPDPWTVVDPVSGRKRQWLEGIPTGPALFTSRRYQALSPDLKNEAQGRWFSIHVEPKLQETAAKIPDSSVRRAFVDLIPQARAFVASPEIAPSRTDVLRWEGEIWADHWTQNPARLNALVESQKQRVTPKLAAAIQQALDLSKQEVDLTPFQPPTGPGLSGTVEERAAYLEASNKWQAAGGRKRLAVAEAHNAGLAEKRKQVIIEGLKDAGVSEEQAASILSLYTAASPSLAERAEAFTVKLAIGGSKAERNRLAATKWFTDFLGLRDLGTERDWADIGTIDPQENFLGVLLGNEYLRKRYEEIRQEILDQQKDIPLAVRLKELLPAVKLVKGRFVPDFDINIDQVLGTIAESTISSIEVIGLGWVLSQIPGTMQSFPTLTRMAGYGLANAMYVAPEGALTVREQVQAIAKKQKIPPEDAERLAAYAENLAFKEQFLVSGITQALGAAPAAALVQKAFQRAVVDSTVKAGLLGRALNLGGAAFAEGTTEAIEEGLQQAIQTRWRAWAAGDTTTPIFGTEFWQGLALGGLSAVSQTAALAAFEGGGGPPGPPVSPTEPEGAKPSGSPGPTEQEREFLRKTGLEDLLGEGESAEQPSAEPGPEGLMPKRPARPSKPPPHPPAKKIFQAAQEGGQSPTPTKAEGEFAAEPGAEASIPFVITNKMRAALAGLGFTAADIAKMRPAEAQTAISERRRLPTTESGPAPRPTPPPATEAVSPPSQAAVEAAPAGPETGPTPPKAAPGEPVPIPKGPPPKPPSDSGGTITYQAEELEEELVVGDEVEIDAPEGPREGVVTNVAEDGAVTVTFTPAAPVISGTPASVAEEAPTGRVPTPPRTPAAKLQEAAAKGRAAGRSIAASGTGNPIGAAEAASAGFANTLSGEPPDVAQAALRAFDAAMMPEIPGLSQEAGTPPTPEEPAASTPALQAEAPRPGAQPQAKTVPVPTPPRRQSEGNLAGGAAPASVPGAAASQAPSPLSPSPTTRPGGATPSPTPPAMSSAPRIWLRAPVETIAATTQARTPSGTPERVHYIPPANDYRFDPQRAIGPTRAPVKAMGFAFPDPGTAARYLSEADLSPVEDGTNLVQVILDVRNPFEIDADHVGAWLDNPQIPAGHDSLLLHSNEEMSSRGLAPKIWVLLGNAENIRPLQDGELPGRGRPSAEAPPPGELLAYLAKRPPSERNTVLASWKLATSKQRRAILSASEEEITLPEGRQESERGRAIANLLLDRAQGVGFQPTPEQAAKERQLSELRASLNRTKAKRAAEAAEAQKGHTREDRATAAARFREVEERLAEPREESSPPLLPAERPGPAEKAAESRSLAERVAEFQRRGGKIQRVETPEVPPSGRAAPTGKPLAALKTQARLTTPEARATWAEIRKRLLEDYRRWWGEAKNPPFLKVVERIVAAPEAGGMYLPNTAGGVIKLVLERHVSPEYLTTTLFHESWHAVEATVLTKEQRNTLDKLFAPGTKGFREVEKYLRDTYLPEAVEEVLREMRADTALGRLEVHAYAAGMWLEGHRFGPEPDSLIAKIAAVLERLREWLVGRFGYETADALFAALESGELAKQAAHRVPGRGRVLKSAIGEQVAEGEGWSVTRERRVKYRVYINPSPERVDSLPRGAVALLLNNGDILAADADPIHADLLNVAYRSGLWKVTSFPQWTEMLHVEGPAFVFRGNKDLAFSAEAADRETIKKAAGAIVAAEKQNPGVKINRIALTRGDVPLEGLKSLKPRKKPETATQQLQAEGATVIQAGNINISKYNDPAAAKALIVRMANTIEPLLAARHMTAEQEIVQAAKYTRTPEKLLRNRLAKGDRAARVIAAAILTKAAAAEFEERIQAYESDRSPANAVALSVAAQRTGMFFELLSTEGTELGRGLQALQTAAKLSASAKMQLKLMEELEIGLGGLKGVDKFIEAYNKAKQKGREIEFLYAPGMGDILVEFVKNAMVSGLSTLYVNNVSNISRAVARPVEVFLAALSSIGAKPKDKVYFQQAIASAVGLAWSSFEALQTLLRTYVTDESSRPWHVTEGKLGAVHKKAMTHPSMPPVVRLLGRVMRFPGYTSLTAWDDALKVIAQRQRTYELATRWAIQHLGEPGSLVQRAARYAKTLPPQEQLEASVDFPERQTATRPALDTVTQGVLRFSNRYPVLSMATGLFFIKTMADLAHTAVEYSPIAPWLSNSAKAELNAGGERRKLAIARMQFGMGLYLLGFFLSLGSDDTNDKDHRWLTGGGWAFNRARGRFKEESMGIPKYSLWDPLAKKWRPYWMYAPFSTIIMLGADAAETAQAVMSDSKALALFGPSYERNAFWMLAGKALNSYWEAGFSTFWAGNMMEFAGALSGDPSLFKTYVGKYLTLPIPKFATQFTNKGAVLDKETLAFFDKVKEDLSLDLPPKVTALGRPAARQGNFLERLLAQGVVAARPWAETDARIGHGLSEKGIYVDAPERTYKNPRTGKDVEYTGHQYMALKYLRGRYLRPVLDKLVRNPGWKNLRQDLAAKAVSSAVGGANAVAGAKAQRMTDIQLRALALEIENEGRKQLEVQE